MVVPPSPVVAADDADNAFLNVSEAARPVVEGNEDGHLYGKQRNKTILGLRSWLDKGDDRAVGAGNAQFGNDSLAEAEPANDYGYGYENGHDISVKDGDSMAHDLVGCVEYEDEQQEEWAGLGVVYEGQRWGNDNPLLLEEVEDQLKVIYDEDHAHVHELDLVEVQVEVQEDLSVLVGVLILNVILNGDDHHHQGFLANYDFLVWVEAFLDYHGSCLKNEKNC